MAPKQSIEDTYIKLTQREHVLHRPNMYIGEVKKTMEEMWVFDTESFKMKKKVVEYSAGFIKIFDEVLSNAVDHSTRDLTLTTIKVQYDKESGEISVYNNGNGIPVVEHKDYKCYVPELIFGNLLSGSNYNDADGRTGAGTNGVGVKCTNIFSQKLVLETVDSDRGLKFVQEFTNNMAHKSKPKVTKNSGKSYTLVTFLPDYKLFGMRGLDNDTISLLAKRVYDCIACTNPKVAIHLNGEKIKGKGLQDYVNYFFDDTVKTYYENATQIVNGQEFAWEYVIVPWDKFEQVSFVNGNSTYQGGKHVDHITYQITNKLKTLLETKKKVKEIKPIMIREKIFLFLRSTIINPQFNSQTKEQLTTGVKDFGCKIEISEKFIDKLWKSSIIEELVEFCKLKETLSLAKATDGHKKSKVYIPKLEDALWAGTAKSGQCTLILTEGDSAKTFALWGRSIVGPERYGVYPLKGKVLNVRDASIQQLMNNEEINNLKQIIGLKQGKDYTDTSDLRYNKVICLTDADADGSHIKGLLINFFHAYWPSLVKQQFIQTLRTPILKAIKGKQVLEFFNEQDFHKWQQATSNSNQYNIKYYKGLGTSTKEDAQSTFRRMQDMQVDYYYKDEQCDEAILLAFEKDKNVKSEVKCSDKRKKWLGTYNKDVYVSANEKKISYQEFVNKELIHFSIYDNLRSIPSLCDGLKPSQRKILYYMLKKDIKKPIKVAQLSGYVSAETSYHHGENSLQQTIIGMAQNFIGSNNVNLLYPDGNFGSRLSGKDAASPRYIFTYLSQITPFIFDPNDTPLLNHLMDDGEEIEPEWYLPVVPMVLVNGCEGIGTGYSTYIPPHNPKDIINNLLRIFKEEVPLPMVPYFKDFNGSVIHMGDGSYVSVGKWNRVSDTQIRVTELPVGTWVTTYKEFLESLIDNAGGKKDTDKKKKQHNIVLKDVQNHTKDENTGIDFLVEFKSSKDLNFIIENSTLEKELKLTRCFNTNNMYLFDDKCTPTRYENTTDILLDFYDIRIEYYEKRKVHMTKALKEELDILNSKARFIDEYVKGQLQINNKKKEFIMDMLSERKYYKDKTSGFDYLVNMPIMSLTQERIESLVAQVAKKKEHLNDIKSKTSKDLWRADLERILKLL
jgi:DNA topoisomerase-2